MPRLLFFMALGLVVVLHAIGIRLPIVGWALIIFILGMLFLNILARRKRPYQNEVDPLHRRRPGMFE